MAICGICAKQLNVCDDDVKIIPLKDLPHLHRLVPRSAHPEHDLYDRKLLEPAAPVDDDSDDNGNSQATVQSMFVRSFFLRRTSSCFLNNWIRKSRFKESYEIFIRDIR